MQTQILSTCQTECAKIFGIPKFLSPELHQRLQLGQGLLDLGHGSRTVDELSVLRIMLLVGDNQREEGYCLSGPGGHLQDTMTPGIEGLFKIAHVGILFGIDTRIREKDGEITRR